MAGLLPDPLITDNMPRELPAWAAPEAAKQLETRWRREVDSSDLLTAAIATYGLKNLTQNRRHELLEFIEDMSPFLDKCLSPFMARVKIKSERTQKEYAADVAKFRRFWTNVGFANIPLPFAADLIAIYICSQAQDGASYAALSRTVTALDYAHRMREEHSPIRDSSIRAALKFAASLKSKSPACGQAEVS